MITNNLAYLLRTYRQLPSVVDGTSLTRRVPGQTSYGGERVLRLRSVVTCKVLDNGPSLADRSVSGRLASVNRDNVES